MSRIGKRTTEIPQGVTVETHGGVLIVSGPKGRLERKLHSTIMVTVADGIASVAVENGDEKTQRSLWGTFSSHLSNMVIGVTTGFTKQLEINGVGYKASMQGTDLNLEVGYSHPVLYPIPDGMSASVEKNVITLESADKEMLGRTAAAVRAIRKPEPYKGKGIKYMDEVIRRKAGKAAKSSA